VTESLYLREDGQTKCWTGAHTSAAAGAILLLVLYSASFPLFCFVLLTRAFTNEGSMGVIGWLRRHVSWLRGARAHKARPGLGKQPSVAAAAELLHAARLQRRREDAYGFLFLSFRPAWFFGCVGVLLLSCALAAVGVFVGQDTPLLQFFLYGLLWTLQLFLIALYLPYDSLKRNVQNVGVGFATLAHSAIFLGVQRGGVASEYMIALLALFALVLAVLLFREKLATNVPWLRVLRRADMKQQEAEILKAAITLEQQLACAMPLEPPSHHVDTPRRLSSSAHRYVYEQAPPEAVSDQEGQPGAPADQCSCRGVGAIIDAAVVGRVPARACRTSTSPTPAACRGGKPWRASQPLTAPPWRICRPRSAVCAPHVFARRISNFVFVAVFRPFQRWRWHGGADAPL